MKAYVRQFPRRLAFHICWKILDTIRDDGIDRNNEAKRGPHLCGTTKQAKRGTPDIVQLKTRLLPPHVEHEDVLEDGEKYNIFDTHLFFMNKDAEAHNNKVFHKQTQTQEHTIKSIDEFSSRIDPANKEEKILALQTKRKQPTFSQHCA